MECTPWVKKHRKMSTCNRLELGTLGSHDQLHPKIFSNIVRDQGFQKVTHISLGHGLHTMRTSISLFPHALGHMCKTTLVQNCVCDILGEACYNFSIV